MDEPNHEMAVLHRLETLDGPELLDSLVSLLHEAEKRGFEKLLGQLQRFQLEGSPPPGDAFVLANWIKDEIEKRGEDRGFLAGADWMRSKITPDRAAYGGPPTSQEALVQWRKDQEHE